MSSFRREFNARSRSRFRQRKTGAHRTDGSEAWAGETARLRLHGARIFIAEDEVLIAMQLCDDLSEVGAQIVGPAHALAEALALTGEAEISAAILDCRLGRGSIEPVAGRLAQRGVPFLFYTGQTVSDPLLASWPGVPIIGKPAASVTLIDAVAGLLARRRTPRGPIPPPARACGA
ncbi:MAG: hypothetical protein JO127_02450 [Caulobacteraceae bacterium]|nr:hypothetical protein [Caulobacteraceae bacterium]